MKTLIISSFALSSTIFAAVAATDATQPLPEGTMVEVNKAVTTHVTLSAKSRVDADIDAWCKETDITLGFVKGKNSFYIKGVERVKANDKDPTFIKSRSLAYSKAYQNAVANYILLKFGRTWSEQYNRVFNDFSEGIVGSDVKGAVERIADKTMQLTEAKLDEGLRKMGVTPSGSPDARRKLAQDMIIKRTIKSASGDSAGLLPVQTFEGWDENGKYAVGVVVRGGIDTEILAECFRLKRRPVQKFIRPEVGLTVEDAMPNPKQLVSQFGVRMFFDKDGLPSLLSIGQWGSSYTGEDEDMAENAMDHAREQAEDEADDFLTMFINSTLSMLSQSDRGEDVGRDVESFPDGASVERAVKASLDRRFKESRMKGNDTLIGRATVQGFPKVIDHPCGQKIAVSARVWSFAHYDAMTGAVERPKVKQAPAVQKKGAPGENRGRTYDF